MTKKKDKKMIIVVITILAFAVLLLGGMSFLAVCPVGQTLVKNCAKCGDIGYGPIISNCTKTGNVTTNVVYEGQRSQITAYTCSVSGCNPPDWVVTTATNGKVYMCSGSDTAWVKMELKTMSCNECCETGTGTTPPVEIDNGVIIMVGLAIILVVLVSIKLVMKKKKKR